MIRNLPKLSRNRQISEIINECGVNQCQFDKHQISN